VKEKNIKEESRKTRRILYVEDDEVFFEMFILYAEQYFKNSVFVNASNVEEAMKLFEEQNFDAIICDYYLPKGNGIDFLIHIRRKNYKIPFIILTGSDVNDVIIEAVNNGVNYYFQKGSLAGEGNNFERLFKQLGDAIARREREISISTSIYNLREKQKIIIDVSVHDWRNLLTGICLSAEQLNKDDLSPEEKRIVSIIISSGESMLDAINFFYDYIRLGDNKAAWQLPCFFINKLVKQFAPKGLLIENRVSQKLIICADIFLEKVFYNLFENAIRHGGAKNVECYTKIEEENLIIVVEDDGTGIIAEQKSSIFEQGYGKNTGYGLFFCQEALSMLGIGIRESGEIGKGARFEIVIPKGKYMI
jgi:signal transduction histidine kinase